MVDLDAIKARVERAVSGPWRYDGMHYEITAPYSPGKYWIILSECRTRPDGPYECDEFGHEFDPTFDFIAHARQDIPALIAEIEELRHRLKASIDLTAIRERQIREFLHPGEDHAE